MKLNLVELPAEMLAVMLRGDPRCSIKKGATVRKVKCDTADEVHKTGSRGKVIGSLFSVSLDPQELYYIQWETGLCSACAGTKVKEVK